jgi:hypothetical protein
LAIAAGLIPMAAAILASLLPATRATRVDPHEALLMGVDEPVSSTIPKARCRVAPLLMAPGGTGLPKAVMAKNPDRLV